MRYRAEIDGLRAVAVVPVVLFHAGAPGFSGGFIGVDVFFVISGYLITSILLADLEAERFSIATFYERRARRILPALSFVLGLSLPFAWFWMTPNQLAEFSGSLASVALFASNFFFWWQTDYFATAAELKPLLHTWSLAVEEQFYLLFPLLLWALWRIARRRIALVLAGLAAASFALMLVLMDWAPMANFFLAPSRAWELLAGSLCALAPARSHGRADGVLALAGLVLLLTGMAVIGTEVPFPSPIALLPVVGTALMILFARHGTLCARLLSARPLVAVGLVSYSYYLVHQPVFAFARLRAGAEPALWTMLALGALSLPLAWISWRYVEAPFRGRRPRLCPDQRSVFAASAVVLVLPIGLGLAGFAARGWEQRFPDIIALEQRAALPPVAGECWFDRRIDPTRAAACLSRAPGRTVLLIGDSHGRAIAAPLRDRFEQAGLHLVSMTRNACFPLPGIDRLPREMAQNRACKAFLDAARRLIDAHPGLPIVVATRWTLNLEGSRFDNAEGGHEGGATVRLARSGEAAPIAGAELAAAVRATLSELSATQPLVLLGQFPEAGWHVPDVVASRLRRGVTTPQLSTDSAVQARRNAAADELLASLSSPRISVVDLESLFCDAALPGRCVNYLDGAIFYSDDDHPSPHASALIAEAALEGLRALQLDDMATLAR